MVAGMGKMAAMEAALKLMDFKGREICTDSSYVAIGLHFLLRSCGRGRERGVMELIAKRESQAV
jgi:hypothetical protein